MECSSMEILFISSGTIPQEAHHGSQASGEEEEERPAGPTCAPAGAPILLLERITGVTGDHWFPRRWPLELIQK
jgi:hypothetical protein